MDRKIILAVAGSGKTFTICNMLDYKLRNIVIAFTNRNIFNINNEILKINENNKFKYTKTFTFHKFIYNFFVRPYEISISELFKCNIKSEGLIFDETEKAIDKDGNYNNKYKTKDLIKHYIKGNRYYSSRLSELVLYLKDNTDIFERAMKNINYFFDYIYIDEFQDFRNENYKLLEEIIKNCNNIILVGDYFQNSVNSNAKSGPPFEKKVWNKTKKKFDKSIITYNEYKDKLKELKLLIDDTSLIDSRRCSKEVCDFVSKKLSITIKSKEINQGNVNFVIDENEAHDILKNNEIMKLTYNMPYKWTFRADSWSYCKGDTYDESCIILTKDLKNIFAEEFSSNSISQITINMFYVALTRTKGNLNIIDFKTFEKIKNEYIRE